MSQPELLKLVSQRLEAAGIDYMVSGSLQSSGRAESDARYRHRCGDSAPASDFAVQLKTAFPEPDFYLDADAVIDAVPSRGMFNLIDAREGDKVDFWLLTDDAFDLTRFDRRYIEVFQGTWMPVSRPEDTILMKLRWAALLGGSEKQYTDALRVYEVQHGRLDEEYLDHWSETLGVKATLTRLRTEARPIA